MYVTEEFHIITFFIVGIHNSSRTIEVSGKLLHSVLRTSKMTMANWGDVDVDSNSEFLKSQ